MRHLLLGMLLTCLAISAQAQAQAQTQAQTWAQTEARAQAQAQAQSVDHSRSVLRYDILHGAAHDALPERVEKVRSIPLAFVMSAVLPGAGQVYNKQYGKAGVALLIEAAAITAYTVLRSNGLAAEDDFRQVAHQSWSPTRYASWLNDYSTYLNAEEGGNITAPPVHSPSGVDFTRPEQWSTADKAAVASMFSEIRSIERQVFHPETGAAFSHQIPDFSAQQYYELIGKYFQFAPGWNDYPEWKNNEGQFTAAIDPEMTGAGGAKPNVSSSFYDYASDHADAQDLLRNASKVSIIFIFNHVIAAVDAAVSSKLHNDRLERSFGLAYDPAGRPVPVASLRITF